MKKKKVQQVFSVGQKVGLVPHSTFRIGRDQGAVHAVVVRVGKRYVYVCTTDQNGEAKPWDEYTFDKTDLKQQTQFSPDYDLYLTYEDAAWEYERAKLAAAICAFPSMSIRQMELEPLKAIYEILKVEASRMGVMFGD